MRKFQLLAAALAITAAPSVLAAQGDASKAAAPKAAPAAPAKPGAAKAPTPLTPEQKLSFQRAEIILRSFNQVMASKEAQQPVKGALLVCLYNNKLSELTAATNRALAASPAGTQPDATAVYRAAAGVCGIKFEAKPAAAGAPKPGTPQKTGDSR